eukprot:c1126_g1_i1 orf=167-709(+)
MKQLCLLVPEDSCKISQTLLSTPHIFSISPPLLQGGTHHLSPFQLPPPHTQHSFLQVHFYVSSFCSFTKLATHCQLLLATLPPSFMPRIFLPPYRLLLQKYSSSVLPSTLGLSCLLLEACPGSYNFLTLGLASLTTLSCFHFLYSSSSLIPVHLSKPFQVHSQYLLYWSKPSTSKFNNPM